LPHNLIQLKGREMKSFLKYFWFDVVFALFAYTTLYIFTGNSWEALQTAMTLTLLELVLSFDNAVITADKVKQMNKFWRICFLTVGVAFAVGFARFLLPLLLVSYFGNMSVHDSLSVALHDHAQFKEIIHHAHYMIASFAGSFLCLLALEFFMDTEKDAHWLKPVEVPLHRLQVGLEAIKFEKFTALIVLSIGYVCSQSLHQDTVFTGCIIGVISFILTMAIKNSVELLNESLKDSKWSLLTNGFGAFLVCELLDLVMSADSVVTAVALSGDVVVIAAGLSVSALAVRSLTIKLVDGGTLETLHYLENGAFLSILALAVSMFVGLFVEIPEWFMGVVSVVLLSGATYSSLKENKQEKQLANS
jgi:hypothetical protein